MTYVNFRHTQTSHYVYHPINSFNLVKRAKYWIPKLRIGLQNDVLENYDILNLPHEYIRACRGLVEIQEHFDLNTVDISNGIIKHLDKKYIAHAKLDSFDLFNIANEAQKAHYYDGSVKWLIAALNQAKNENKSSNYLMNLR